VALEAEPVRRLASSSSGVVHLQRRRHRSPRSDLPTPWNERRTKALFF
jgi:hypothetical protein